MSNTKTGNIGLAELEELLLKAAEEAYANGPGFAQESVVLRDVAERYECGEELAFQQDLLTAWHDLFRKGKLSWGYDVDNPSAPFFHIPRPRA